MVVQAKQDAQSLIGDSRELSGDTRAMSDATGGQSPYQNNTGKIPEIPDYFSKVSRNPPQSPSIL